MGRVVNLLHSEITIPDIALVARTTHQVKLTSPGVIYYERCIELVNGIDQANEIVTAGQIELRGLLRVTAAGEFAEKTVVPALLEFVAQHPDLNLELDYNPRVVNFVEENFDFAVRFGALPDSNLIARKLSNHSYIAAASPEYLEKFGRPNTPQALTSHSCITTTYNRWSFIEDNNDVEVTVHARVRANSVRSVINACKAGWGVAYLPGTSFGEAFNNGELHSFLEGYWKNSGTTSIVYANRKYLPARARLAIDFLIRKFQDH